jgi:hypothetical protein
MNQLNAHCVVGSLATILSTEKQTATAFSVKRRSWANPRYLAECLNPLSLRLESLNWRYHSIYRNRLIECWFIFTSSAEFVFRGAQSCDCGQSVNRWQFDANGQVDKRVLLC